MIPRPYQIAGRDFLAGKRFALLADEMRVGKTPQAILAAAKVGARDTLVVCPAIAVEHWRREWVKWQGPGEVTVMSYDRAKLTYAGAYIPRRDLVIVDECHFAKNPETDRTKLIYGKGGLIWRTERLWALSGTPAPKHAGELWPMLRAFGVTQLSYEVFVSAYCDINWYTGRVTGTKTAMIPVLRDMLSKIMLRRSRKEVAPEMPEISYSFLPVEADVDFAISDVTAIEDYIEAGDAEGRKAVALSKVPALFNEIRFNIDNSLLRQTVVFGWHVDALMQLASKLSFADITCALLTGATPAKERERIQRDFADGRIQVLCANILAAGTAIDLSAASHGYFLELDWVPGNNAQAASRLIAVGKDEPVTFDIATRADSVDEAVQRTLIRRARELSKLFAQ